MERGHPGGWRGSKQIREFEDSMLHSLEVSAVGDKLISVRINAKIE